MSRKTHLQAEFLVYAKTAGHSLALDIVQLGMPKQQLNRPQILGALVDQGRLGSPHRMRSIG